jgi:hypothetical protein
MDMKIIAGRWEPASIFVVSAVLGVSPVLRRRARGAGHCIGPCRTKEGFGHTTRKTFFCPARTNFFGGCFKDRCFNYMC